MKSEANRKHDESMSAVALIDGEHYPDVTIDALESIEEEHGYRLAALIFLGGAEKLEDPDSLSYRSLPVYSGAGAIADLRRALDDHDVEVVIDLSDEPVLGYRERFRLVSEALARGVSYRGSDFYFRSPFRPFLCAKPSIGVWGLGKRVGKTAISGYLARHLSKKGSVPCVVTMGRGGPADPELLDSPGEVDDGYLRARAEQGRHAASDHFEDAMMGRVVAVGCRRSGGGMAGEPFYSNVEEGARLSCTLESDIVVFEGSGAAIPPVGVDSVLLVASAAQPPEYILEYLGPYRILLSDVVVVTMCEKFFTSSSKLRKSIDGILSINPRVKVIKTVFRPRPLGDLRGKKVFLTSTAPGRVVGVQGDYLGENYGAVVVGASPNLADRRGLEKDLEGALDAQVLVTELKAAGVDTVSLFAKRHGKDLVYLENLPVSVEGSLKEEIDYLEALARERLQGRRSGL